MRLNALLRASAAGVALVALAAGDNARAGHVPSVSEIGGRHGPTLVLPMMDPDNGKTLFVSKGCIACHAVNGVGGHDAPPLDAHGMKALMNPFDFAAKMWNHAPAMIAAQESALGEQIYFTGHELADIIAFCHDDEAQHAFSEKDVTPVARKMMGHDHGAQSAPAAHSKEVGHGARATPARAPQAHGH